MFKSFMSLADKNPCAFVAIAVVCIPVVMLGAIMVGLEAHIERKPFSY